MTSLCKALDHFEPFNSRRLFARPPRCRAKEGSTVVSTVKDTGVAISLVSGRRFAAEDQREGHPPAWPKYQTRKARNDSQTPLRQNGLSYALRVHDRDGHAPFGRRFAAEKWVMRTEALGSAKEAHRRWPEGRSEQGASKANDEPSQFSNRADALFLLWRLCCPKQKLSAFLFDQVGF